MLNDRKNKETGERTKELVIFVHEHQLRRLGTRLKLTLCYRACAVRDNSPGPLNSISKILKQTSSELIMVSTASRPYIKVREKVSGVRVQKNNMTLTDTLQRY